MLAGDGLLQEVLVNVVQNVDQRTVGDLLHAVEDLLVALLGHHALLGIAVAMAEAEQLLPDHLQLQLRAPAEVLGEGQGHAVAVVDLGEHVAVGGIHNVAAEHAGEAVAGQHGALAGAAAGHHVIRRAGFQQQGGQQARLDVGQLAGVVGGVHAVVDHGVAHGLHNLLQGGFNEAVLGSLAVFVDQGDTHGYHHPFVGSAIIIAPFCGKSNPAGIFPETARGTVARPRIPWYNQMDIVPTPTKECEDE